MKLAHILAAVVTIALCSAPTASAQDRNIQSASQIVGIALDRAHAAKAAAETCANANPQPGACYQEALAYAEALDVLAGAINLLRMTMSDSRQ